MNVATDEIGKIDNMIKVWPNPTNDWLHISHSFGVSSLQIVDMQGRVMWKSSEGPEGAYDINVEHLNAGSYLLYVKSYDGMNFVRTVSIQ